MANQEGIVNRSFREFIQRKQLWSEMAMGVSQKVMRLRITQPLTNLLSLIPGIGLKTKALNWLLSEGLMKASQGREELTKWVNAALEQQHSNPKIVSVPRPPENILPSQKVVGMSMEAQEPWGAIGEDPYERNSPDFQPVNPNDLFSPLAWKRRPELAKIRLNEHGQPDPHGLDILSLYDRLFEPKYMVLEYNPRQSKDFDLEQMRAILKNAGLTPFKYGGFDGYIQYIEKGDYLPSETKRSQYTNNQQFGIDLRPESRAKRNADGSLTHYYAPNLIDTDKTGDAIVNFAGGRVAVTQRGTDETVKRMIGVFNQAMDQIEKGEEVANLSPEEAATFKKLLHDNKQIERLEANPMDIGTGKGGPGSKSGVTNSTKGPAKGSVPYGVDPQVFLKIIAKGLSLPSVADEARTKDVRGERQIVPTFRNPEAFQWFEVKNGKINYRYTQQQQQELLRFITRELDRTGNIYYRFDLGDSRVLRECPAIAALKPYNIRFLTSPIYNRGFKSSPELAKQVMMTMHRMPGVDPKQFVRNTEYHPIQVDPLHPDTDPLLSKLLDSGYRWDLKTPEEQATGKPDLEVRKIHYLKQHNSVFEMRQGDDGKWYLYARTNQGGEPFRPANQGDIGDAWLAAGDTDYSGGTESNHVTMRPAGPKTWAKLQDMLMNGELGEPASRANYDPTKLPSVVNGVASAKQWFDSKKGPRAADNLMGNEKEELYNWGLEALYMFSGDPAFQVGFISHEEIEKILGWDLSQEVGNEKDGGQGKGIIPLMLRHGIKNPQLHNDLIQHVLDQHGTTPIIDLEGLDDEADNSVKRAFGENAYRARIRAVAHYVQDQLLRKYKTERDHQLTSTDQGPKGKNGEEKAPEVQGQSLASDRGNYSDDRHKIFGHEDILKDFAPDVAGKTRNKMTHSGSMSPPSMPTAVVHPVSSRPPAKRLSGSETFLRSATPKKKPEMTHGTRSNSLDFLQQHTPATSNVKTPVLASNRSLDFLKNWSEGIVTNFARLLSYKKWIAMREGDAVFDPNQKPHDGCGWNWWGAPGKPGGVSVQGDPIKPKGSKHGKAKRAK